MAEQQQIRGSATQAVQESSSREGRPHGGEAADEPPWRIEGEPAGAAPEPQLPGDPPRGLRWGRMFLALVAMLAVNWLIAGLLFSGASTLNVSYTFFRSQVQAGNVSTITAKGNAIHGTFKQPVTNSQANGNPPAKNEPTYTPFTTQLPAFGTGDLMALLDQGRRRQRPVRGDALVGVAACLLRPGPAALGALRLVRAARPGGGRRGRHDGHVRQVQGAQVRARGDAHHVRRRGRHRRGQAELTEVVDFLARPDATASSAPASRAACCSPASPAPARRCSRGPWPARPRCPSSGCRPRSSSRCSWASAPAACATSSSRPRSRPLRSSSSTSSTPSAGRARPAARWAATTSASRR